MSTTILLGYSARCARSTCNLPPRRYKEGLIAGCLVIGGGFIGAHLATRLARDGNDVTLYSRSFSEWLLRKRKDDSGQIRLIEGEVPPGRGLTRLIANADVVFYMAGASTPAMASNDPGGSISRHVVPAAAVLDLMRETASRRLVIASSGGTVYGIATRLPTPEDHPTQPISLHGHHSLAVERYAQFFAERYDFEPIILRFSNPYGPGQIARRGQGVIAAWSLAIAREDPLVVYGDLGTQRDFLYIDDLIEATVRAGLSAPAGVYNVGSGISTPLREVIHLLIAKAGKPTEVVEEDARPVDVPITHLDCSRLQYATGWHPTVSLADGINASLEWAQSTLYRVEA
ncbi:MAG TPA: NAD-dependent epimerase/dehydratase family protein [Solirubrobacteraceae bacterium]|nr:NAD-dependent epimerase/dehydratase family protein [Solirubrobacteraceae bacterium]